MSHTNWHEEKVKRKINVEKINVLLKVNEEKQELRWSEKKKHYNEMY